MITSPCAKEGISLFRVKKAFIVNIPWNYSLLRQILGRVIRTCSHKDTQFKEVDIELLSVKDTVDDYLLYILSKKQYYI